MTHLASSQADGHASSSIAEQVTVAIADALNLELAEVLDGCSLVNDFGATRDDVQTLRFGLETRFGITIPRHALQGWSQVADVVRYISGRVS